MSAESWRDDPTTIWLNACGTELWAENPRGIGVDVGPLPFPTPAEAPEVVERFARALGCVLPGGVELAPRPIEVGDRVREDGNPYTAEVIDIDQETTP